MSDLISRQSAIDAADSIINRDTSGNNDVVKAMIAWKEYIKGLPSAQPERKKGKWIPQFDKWGDYVTTTEGYKCSECGEFDSMKDNFCPNCGAEMEQ